MLQQNETRKSYRYEVYATVTQLEQAEQALISIKKTTQLSSKVSGTIEAINHKNELKKTRRDLESTLQHYTNASKDLKEIQKELSQTQGLLDSHMPEVCPLCDQKILK
jgi:hypothetical protein